MMSPVVWRGLMTWAMVTSLAVTVFARTEPADEQPTTSSAATSGDEHPDMMLSLTRVAPESTPYSDYSGELFERYTLVGDPRGWRQRAYEKGFTLDVSFTQVVQSVVSGGRDNDSAYTGLVDYGATVDTGKLDWWPGGLFVFNFQSSFTSGFPLESGSVSPANFTSIYPTPDHPDTFPMEYYLMQGLSENMAIIIGRLNPANFLDLNRFANKPENQFLNLSLGLNPLFGSFISMSTYGALLSYKVNDHVTISPAVFDPNTKAGDWRYEGGGIFHNFGTAVEVDVAWDVGDDLNGSFKTVGAYVSKDPVALDNPRLPLDILVGNVKRENDNYIVALNLEQYIWKPESSASTQEGPAESAVYEYQDPGVGVFGRFGYTPEDRNLWNLYASGGVGARGVLPGRPHDRMGTGVYWLGESEDLDGRPGDAIEDEWGSEVFYNFAITPSTQLSVDMQWINSGVSNVDNSFILGMRLFIAL